MAKKWQSGCHFIVNFTRGRDSLGPVLLVIHRSIEAYCKDKSVRVVISPDPPAMNRHMHRVLCLLILKAILCCSLILCRIDLQLLCLTKLFSLPPLQLHPSLIYLLYSLFYYILYASVLLNGPDNYFILSREVQHYNVISTMCIQIDCS